MSDRRWKDVCLAFTNDGRDVYVYTRLGDCDEDKLCVNRQLDIGNHGLPTQTSDCIPRPGGRTVVATNPDGGAEQQTGVVGVAGRVGPNHVISISIVTSISGASVSAFIEGTESPH